MSAVDSFSPDTLRAGALMLGTILLLIIFLPFIAAGLFFFFLTLTAFLFGLIVRAFFDEPDLE